jgi:hypothetical protein
MRSVFLSLLAVVLVFSMHSCDRIGDISGKSQIVKDSLVNIFPTWQSAKITIGDNNTSMSVVIGDATFYNAPDDVKKAKAVELGKMVLRICGKENFLEKGELIVTADIRNISASPTDGKVVPIDFTALKKTVENK